MVRSPLFRERFKRALSGFLVFAILFGQTFRFPLLETSRAAENSSPNLVAVVVGDSAYSGDVEDRIDRYAADVQAALPGSRAIVVTVPNDAQPDKIAAMLERLYYEGDGKDSSVSRLVGAVFVGDLPFPVAHAEGKTFLSVFPYVDFVDKSFAFDSAKGYYERSKGALGTDTPEIWHGIVRPNTGDASRDREKLVAFFDKTHEYYAKTGVFAPSKTRVEPAVFYFDGVHDQLSSRLSEWKSYRLMLEKVEDLAYRRYSKHLAKEVFDKYDSYLNE